jgi:hypothetical protein
MSTNRAWLSTETVLKRARIGRWSDPLTTAP